MSLTHFGVSHSNTSFTFSFSILIPSGPITTPKNSIFYIFHSYFSGFTYKSFSSNFLITSTTISLCISSISIPTITLSIKTAVKIVDGRLYFIFSFHFILLFFLFYFSFLFPFNFLFLEQLGLGFISHAVTSVTN